MQRRCEQLIRYRRPRRRCGERSPTGGHGCLDVGGLGHRHIRRVRPASGGRYSVYTTAPGHETGWPTDRWGFLGYYVEIVENRRLVYTIHWDGPVGYNQTGAMVVDEAVIVEMDANGDATDVVMWHLGIPPDGVSAAEHGSGIVEMFGALDRLVAG